jgi:Putative adhesin
MSRMLRYGAGVLALACGLAVLAGCSSAGTSGQAPAAGAATGATSSGPVPGTHQTTRTYQIAAPVSTVIVVSRAGSVSITGGTGAGVSVAERLTYSNSPPVTSRAVSGRTLTASYTCPAQVVCAVSYVLRVPASIAVQATTTAGAIRLADLSGKVTAEARAGLISATGLRGASVTLTNDVGAINATFAAPPATIQAVTRVGAINLRVPDSTAYKVNADAHVGKATVSVRQSASSTHAITASTDVGAIVIAPPG